MFPKWLRPSGHRRRATSHGDRPRFRPRLEGLEDRVVPSGDFGFAVGVGAPAGADGGSVAIDVAGNSYLTGSVNGGTNLSPGIYAAKHSPTGAKLWSITLPSDLGARGLGIGVDDSGNVYVAGYFRGMMDFDPGAVTFNLTSAGGADVFVLKLTGNGQFAWARRMGGSDDDFVQALAVDGAGNVYTTGHFYGTADFDPGPGTYNLSCYDPFRQAVDIFVSELNSSGSFVLARRMGGNSSDGGYGITVDAAGNIYVCGVFRGSASFGTITLGSAGYIDAFVVKLDPTGSSVWAAGLGGSSTDKGLGVAVDSGGNVYALGTFGGTADFDPGPGAQTLTTSPFATFLAKLGPDGTYRWAREVVRSADPQGPTVAVDGAGNVTVAGRFYGTSDFDPGPGTYNLISAGSSDVYVSRLTGAGGFLWARGMGGSGSDSLYGLAVDRSGDVTVAGTFEGTADFDPGPASHSLTAPSFRDLYLARLVEGPKTAVPLVIDSGQAGYAETGPWATYAAGYNGSLRYVAGAGTATATASWQASNLTPGLYDVQVDWLADPNNRASNATYQVYDGPTLIGTASVNQRNNPVGTPLGGVVFQSLGKFFTATGTLRVVLSNQANGTVVADAMRVAPVPPAAEVVDRGAAGYAETGAWYDYAPGHGGGLRYTSGSATATASAAWQASRLTPGTYDVQVTWLADPTNRASNATYKIYDGDYLIATVVLDQRVNPTGTTVNGSVFQNLGRFKSYAGSLRVVLTNQANGLVIADAARFAWVG